MTVDFYDLLGIDEDASQEEVRRAFREQVREYHPDRNDDPRAPAQFTAIKKAYETLGDPDEREEYDRMGHNSYCAKRVTHLPSPEQWQLPDRDGEGHGVTDDGGRQEPVESSTDGEPGRADADPGPEGGSTRASGAAGSGPGGRRSRNRASARTNSKGNAQTTGSAASAAAAGSSHGGARTHTGSGGPTAGETHPVTALRQVARWIQGVSIGWPLILFSDTLYAAGLAMYLAHAASGVGELAGNLAAAAVGPESVSGVLGTTHGIVPLSDYIASNVSAGSVVGGALLILGMAFLPSVYFFVIRETRRIHTPWQPSYLYVLGALGPVTGLVLNATLSPAGLYLDVVCYVVLPLSSVLGLPFSAFVRPRILRLVRKTHHRLTN